jgi:U3 small nucleolar RNA-associated protein 4
MDIHRCRFVPYPPSAINALAFSHTTARKGKVPASLRLAIGRANGDIEIWNPLKGAWFHEITLRGGKDQSIEGLAWIQNLGETSNGHNVPGKLRLFSIGNSSFVTEWNLEDGTPLRHSDNNYGEIWCLASQPPQECIKEKKKAASKTEYPGQNLIIGCADGSVVLLSTEDDQLSLKRALARPSTKKARILSIVFQNRYTVIAGCADSTIRVFDARSGALRRLMTLGPGPTGGPRETLVWSVRCLPDGTIISGDSSGEIRFWDGKSYTLRQRIQSHRADILDIAASANGETIISGGMDRRSIVYRKTGNAKRWAEVTHRRFHSHDVKAMATFESPTLNVVVSGGKFC